MCMNPVFTVYIPFHRSNEVSAESSILFQTINTINALRRAMAYKVMCSLRPLRSSAVFALNPPSDINPSSLSLCLKSQPLCAQKRVLCDEADSQSQQ